MKAAALLPSLLVFFMASCSEHSCNAMGCMPHTELELSEQLSQEGSYTFTVEADGTVESCVVTIPRGNDEECTGEAGLLSIRREEIETRTGDSVSGRSGNTIISIIVRGEHETLNIKVSLDNTDLLEEQVTPEYEGVEINGEGCGECPHAYHLIR